MTQSQLFRTRRFLPLFLTQFLGAFNDNLFKNALVMLVTFRATSVWGIPPAQIVAVAGALFILPFFLFSAQAGQLADKVEKSRLIRATKLAEVAIMLFGAAGLTLHRYEWLLVALFLMGTQAALFGPLKYSILPQHLDKDELVGGNAMVEAGTFLAILLGTIAGGVLVLLEPHGPAIVAGSIVTVAVAGWVASLSIPKADPVDPNLHFRWNPITPTVDILRTTRKTRSVFLSILGISWFWFFGGFLLSVFPAYCKEVLHADSSVATLFLALFSMGIGLGSLLCERLSRHHLELGLVPFGSIGMSLFAADLYFAGPPAALGAGALLGLGDFASSAAGLRILADLTAMATFGGFFIVPLYTLVQSRSEESHRSRIIAGNNIVNALFMVAASGLLMGLMKARFTVPQMFLTLAVVNAVVAAYIYTVIPEFLLRFLVWGLANVMYRLKVRGAVHVPKEGAAVLICNHVSFVDWMILAAGVKRPVRFIMDHSFAKGFLAKALLRQAKVIPIASAKVDAALMEQAFEKAAAELRDGELVCIFPEGKITYDGKLNVFKPGIERLVRETPVPVIPMALKGLWGSFFSRQGGAALRKPFRRFWSRLELEIGAPVPPKSVSAHGLQAEVARMLGEPMPTAPADESRARRGA
jgi:1-acyl-sn-glycerol-3-phosphate acyltransferase